MFDLSSTVTNHRGYVCSLRSSFVRGAPPIRKYCGCVATLLVPKASSSIVEFLLLLFFHYFFGGILPKLWAVAILAQDALFSVNINLREGKLLIDWAHETPLDDETSDVPFLPTTTPTTVEGKSDIEQVVCNHQYWQGIPPILASGLRLHPFFQFLLALPSQYTHGPLYTFNL